MKSTMFTMCILTALAVIATDCKGPKGDDGPTGPQGPIGPQGPSVTTYRNLWEDFESGTFGAYPWQLTGNANWQITSAFAMFGTYSASSGPIGNSQASTVAIQVNLPVASIVTFYWMVDSESGYDWVDWSIDGYLIDGRSGHSGGFYPATFGISPGTHTISWSYTKDASGGSGTDKAWIDGILITDYTLAKQSMSSANPIPPGVVSRTQQ